MDFVLLSSSTRSGFQSCYRTQRPLIPFSYYKLMSCVFWPDFSFRHSFRWSRCSGKASRFLRLLDTARSTFLQPAEIEEETLWRCRNPGIAWRRSHSKTDLMSRWTHDAPPVHGSSCEAWQSACSITERTRHAPESRTAQATPLPY